MPDACTGNGADFCSGVKVTAALLTVNEKKTRVCKLPEEKFDFLGYSVLQKHTDKEFIMN
jgi:hypothetical protein